MATLRIPDSYRPGLAAILALDDASVDALASTLADAPTPLSATDLSSWLNSRVNGIPPDSIDNIARTLLSLYSLRAHLESSVSDIVDDILEAIGETGLVNLGSNGMNRARFKLTLVRLLSIDSLSRSVKMLDVLHEYEHAFCTARILTDIRPIFGLDPAAPPVEAVVVHTLKITYHEGEQLKNIFVAMDAHELQRLRDVIDRADVKAESLRSILDAAGIPYPEGT